MALQILNSLPASLQQHPTTLYLTGGAQKALGDVDGAIRSFSQSLKLAPQQPQVANALGAAFQQKGDIGAAQAQFRHAVSIEPRFAEAWINLGRLGLEQNDLSTAQEAIAQAARLAPQDARVKMARGRLAQALGDYAGATSAFREVIVQAPDYLPAYRFLAASQKSAGDLEAARSTLDQALGRQAENADLRLDAARLALSVGEIEAAAAHAQKAVEAVPQSLSAAELLSRIRYISGDPRFLDPYLEGLAHTDDKNSFLSAYGMAAAASGQAAEALARLEGAIKGARGAPEVISVAGYLAQLVGEGEKALSFSEAAYAAAPTQKAIVQNRAMALMVFGQADEAIRVAREAVALDPSDQLGLGYLTTAAQLAGDAQAGTLFDLHTMTQQREIEPPAGFSSLKEFNTVLREELLRLHRGEREPIDQSLRGGTQIELSGLVHQNRLIAALAEALAANVARFAKDLPHREGHPFFGRRPETIRFSGMWSVCLKEGGRHVSHAHPEGWLSSAYYVSLPEDVSAADPEEAGWLVIGDPPFPTPRPTQTTTFAPREGTLILFPSYAWHGTKPFRGDEPRLTVAFDVMPA